MLNNIPTVDFSAFTAPMQKLVELNVAKFESAVAAQQDAAKALVELTETRAKAAAEIKDVDGFVSFFKEQAELAQENATKLAEDSKTAVQEAQAYGEEVQKILTESTDAVKDAIAKVA